MAKLIPLDEAAAQLGITSDELAEARSRGDVFGYRDGATWKFKEGELDRYAGTLDISANSAESGGLPSVAPVDQDLDELVSVTDLGLDDDDDSEDPDSLLVSEQELGESDPVGGSTIIGKDELADDLNMGGSEVTLESAVNLLDDDEELKLESDIKIEEPGETIVGDSEINLAADSEIALTDSDSELRLDGGSSELNLEPSDVMLDDSAINLSGSELNLEGSEIGLEGSDLKLEGSEISLEDSELDLTASASSLLSDADLLAASSGSLDNDEDDDLVLDESGLSGDALSIDLDGDDEIDLDGSALDLDASGTGVNLLDSSGSDITLDASSSGINLNPSDSGISLEASGSLGSGVEALELGEADEFDGLDDELIDPDLATEIKSDDDFLLSPVDGDLIEDEESGSQVIALEAEEVDFDETGETILAEGGFDDVADFEELEADSAAADAAAPVTAIGAPVAVPSATSSLPEAPFSIWNVLFLGLSVLLLSLCGIMVMDLLRNMWSWQEPYSLTSSLMEGILSLIGQ